MTREASSDNIKIEFWDPLMKTFQMLATLKLTSIERLMTYDKVFATMVLKPEYLSYWQNPAEQEQRQIDQLMSILGGEQNEKPNA